MIDLTIPDSKTDEDDDYNNEDNDDDDDEPDFVMEMKVGPTYSPGGRALCEQDTNFLL